MFSLMDTHRIYLGVNGIGFADVILDFRFDLIVTVSKHIDLKAFENTY